MRTVQANVHSLSFLMSKEEGLDWKILFLTDIAFLRIWQQNNHLTERFVANLDRTNASTKIDMRAKLKKRLNYIVSITLCDL